MNVLIIHGENTALSYDKYLSLKDFARKKNWQVISLNENSDIRQKFSSNSLFEQKQFFILENIKKFKGNDLDWFSKNYLKLSGNILIYERSVIGKNILRKFDKKVKVKEFVIPKTIYKFLESFCPGSSGRSIILLHDLIKNEPVEFIFVLLSRHLKDLYWVKKDPKGLPYEPWKVKKLEIQSERFSSLKLKRIIKKMARIDIDVKTSKTDLLDSLDLLMTIELE
jgi:DNA polymerase III delta subunit